MKTPIAMIERLEAALAAAHPDRPYHPVLLGRILWARYLSPQAKFRVGKEWDWNFGWMHMVGRDRHNGKELKRLYDAGVREYQGCKIYDGNGEPYIDRWTKDDVWEVFQDIEALPNLKEILEETC